MFTKQEILAEYLKCLEDPAYGIQTYFKTFDKTQEGFVQFKLFPRQKEIIHAYNKHRFNLVTKPRQAGVSTTTAAYLAIKVGFADYDNPEAILIVANKQELAFEFLAKVKDFLSQLPRWVWGPEYYGTEVKEKKTIFITDSKKEIKLPNGSRVKAVATSKDALRGFTPTYLIMDEAAYILDGAEVFGAALTALGTGGNATLISTPNGMDALYYKTYEQSKAKKNNFNIIEMKWYEDLRYNKGLRWLKKIKRESNGEEWDDVEEVKEFEFTFDSYNKMIKAGYKPTSFWYEEMCRGMNNDARMIAQELDVSFIGSGGNVITEGDIEFQEITNVKDPIRIEGENNEEWTWADPEAGHEYIIGCLPPNEKVLTDSGLKNIQEITLQDKLVNSDGEYVNIINTQIYSVIDEDIYNLSVDNTFRTTKFTKEHPILVSSPVLKRNYNKDDNKYRFNERYWDFNFTYKRVSEINIGDWLKVPNTYKKEISKTELENKWCLDDLTRIDFKIPSPLLNKDFWWLVGMWLGDGWLGKYKQHGYSISLCFNKDEYYYLEKSIAIIELLLSRTPSIIERNSTFEIVFNSKELYHFLLKNFGQYSYSKKISEWVKFIPNEFKLELIQGYFNSDGCWIKVKKSNECIHSKLSFVSINLELLESIQDILFSLGIISSLNKLRNAGKRFIKEKESITKECYNLCLANYDSLKLISMFPDLDDLKLSKFKISDFDNINNRIISSCHFDSTESYIYFRVKSIDRLKYTGDVYNFECDTHTFMCHHISTHNCDVSRGDGEDSSTIVVLDVTTMEEVFEYEGKIQPDLLAQKVEFYGNKYEAYTVVDITGGMGVATVLKLLEFDYKRLHYDTPQGKIFSAQQTKLQAKAKGDKIPGFSINSVRTTMISHFEQAVRNNLVKVRSRRLTSEMKTFVYVNGRANHMKGYHDDLIFALAMALWVVEHSFKNLKKLKEQTKAMLESWGGGIAKTLPQEPEELRGTSFVATTDKGKERSQSPNSAP